MAWPPQPAFTLDIYGHLMTDDHEASLRQVEAIFATASARHRMAQ
jgi:hypothetical protein